MIVYLDTSALIKILIEEDGSDVVATLWDSADTVATSLLTYPEGRSALAMAARQGRLTEQGHSTAKGKLRNRVQQMFTIYVTPGITLTAGDLAETQRLRGYDALHLASAMTLIEPELTLATWDRDLARASQNLGIQTAGINPR